ncbi:MAG: glutamate 5-kinase [Thermodesulfobacteriota bacterium]
MRKERLGKVRRIVIKVGSSILASLDKGLNHEVFSHLTKEISELKRQGYEIVLVSSGAIAAGMEKLGYKVRPQSITQKQATAAVGQTRLMNIYETYFSKHQQMVAQILLTHEDLSHRKRFINARNTLLTLLQLGIIPIINENDTVVVDEIKFGDNDHLSALITNLIEADLLVILTNMDGIYESDPRRHPEARPIPLIEDIDSNRIKEISSKASSPMSVGGMMSKIQAAQKASRFGVPTLVACGTSRGILHQILKGKEVGTLILPKGSPLSSRKYWIAFTLKPKGEIIVDDGAKKAIVQMGKSLLPSGIVKVRGSFDRGDSVSCLGLKGKEFARGLVNYSQSELEMIKGLQTDQIEKVLGYKYLDEVIHRDDLVVI